MLPLGQTGWGAQRIFSHYFSQLHKNLQWSYKKFNFKKSRGDSFAVDAEKAVCNSAVWWPVASLKPYRHAVTFGGLTFAMQTLSWKYLPYCAGRLLRRCLPPSTDNYKRSGGAAALCRHPGCKPQSLGIAFICSSIWRERWWHGGERKGDIGLTPLLGAE